jgi:uncharacterized membrane protein
MMLTFSPRKRVVKLDILLSASPAIQFHVAAALGALALGSAQFATRPGSGLHRGAGYGWVALILVVTLSSFFISANPVIGRFSWIHGLSLFTTIAVLVGIAAAATGRRRAHAALMKNIFWFALVVTGLFTLLPGRVMHAFVFG